MNYFTGFKNPAEDAGDCFRSVLKAMSEPGHVVDFKDAHLNTSQALYPTTWAIMQTLLDAHCTTALSPELNTESVIRSLHFHTGTRLIESHQEADFCLLNADEFELLTQLKAGSLQSPHQACTAIIQVSDFHSGTNLKISGPGINGNKTIAIEGLSKAAIQKLQENHRRFPCGFDTIFCSATQFMALPRSTQIAPLAPLKEIA